jgi:tetratricopeptide (TPR) repeat protein
LPLPDDVRAVLERRLARLSQPCHQLLQVAAVSGKTFDGDVASELAGLPQDGAGYLDEAAFARIVHPTETGQWEFAHDLVRETLYGSLVPSLARELHLRVGEALERAYAEEIDAHFAELAHHYLRGGEGGPAGKGTVYSTGAGRRAMGLLAYEEAVAHFERAIDALGPPSPASADERTALLLDLGEARLWAGDWEAATTTLNEAAGIARSRRRPHDLARAALGLGSGLGGFEVPLQDFSQVDLLEEALRALDGEESVLRARVLARLSVALAWIAPVERQIELAGEALELCRRLGDESALVYMLASWCDAIGGPDHIEERLGAANEMLEIAQRVGDLEGALLARRLRVVALLEQGDPAVDGEIEAFGVLADRLGAPLFRWYVPQFRGCRAAMAGRLDHAEQLLLEVEAIGEQAQSENASMLAMSLRVQLHRAQGRHEELIEMLAFYAERFGWVAPVWPWAALSYAENGDLERGRHFLEQLAVDDFSPLERNGEWLPSMAFAAEAAVIIGDAQIADEIYDLLSPYGSRFAVDGILGSCLGACDRYLGSLAAVSGRHDDAVVHYERALESNGRGGAPLFVAYTELDYGRCLLARDADGDRQRGAALVKRAAAALTRMGAVVPNDPLATTVGVAAANCVRREGALWTLSFGGKTVTIPDAKGLHDLAWLVAHPGKEVAAAELMGVPAQAVGAGGDAVLDDRARAAYKRRLQELEDDLAEAESFNDTERASRAREERDFLAAELAGALGLGGRDRKLGDSGERARKAVTMRIRNSVGRIAKVHPDLARHLERSVRTGAFCSYEPETPMEWHA